MKSGIATVPKAPDAAPVKAESPPLWIIVGHPKWFIVHETGRALGYFYLEDESVRFQ
jgi:hypothetical protein